MRPIALVTSFLVLPTLLGCVPQSQYDDLMNAYRSQEQQLLQAQSDLETSRANQEALRMQIAQAMSEIGRLGGDRDSINAALDKLLADYNNLLNRPTAFGPLPAEVDSALQTLAAQYPELLTYDSSRGMLRFNTDFTFDLGSAELKPQARQLIPTLAGIMNSTAASGLEAHIIGHTDNVPVSNPTTIKLHKNNVGLSVNRSISVRDALVSAGVTSNRFMVAGFGEYRPVVANQGNRGAAGNRRVEIFFRPMSGSVLPAGSDASSAPTRESTTPSRPVEPLK